MASVWACSGVNDAFGRELSLPMNVNAKMAMNDVFIIMSIMRHTKPIAHKHIPCRSRAQPPPGHGFTVSSGILPPSRPVPLSRCDSFSLASRPGGQFHPLPARLPAAPDRRGKIRSRHQALVGSFSSHDFFVFGFRVGAVGLVHSIPMQPKPPVSPSAFQKTESL